MGRFDGTGAPVHSVSCSFCQGIIAARGTAAGNALAASRLRTVDPRGARSLQAACQMPGQSPTDDRLATCVQRTVY
jgi:hypothetical protein